MRESHTPEELREFLRYEEDTGKLFWRLRNESHFAEGKYSPARLMKRWNTLFAGKEAGSVHTDPKDGYQFHCIRLGKRLYKSSRVIWAMKRGVWPDKDIDHRDTDSLNNRWGNLRKATKSENAWNRRTFRGRRYKGVHFHIQRQKWIARITVHSVQYHLGVFDTPEEAYVKVCEARLKYHGEFARAA
jgi:hypothetical protein